MLIKGKRIEEATMISLTTRRKTTSADEYGTAPVRNEQKHYSLAA
jgi:hypothetical protein